MMGKLISDPITYLIISLIILMFSHRSLRFINIGVIVKEYYVFLKNHKLIAFFIFLPAALATSGNLAFIMDNDFVENIVIIITLLISMFFSYISFYSEYDYDKIKDQTEYSEKKKNIEQCLIVINYEILISVIALLICLLYPVTNNNLYLKYVLSWFIYFFFIQLILNLFIILKRYFKIQ